ncbi:MAG: circadian clock protein KaiB [Bacteroidetes bacterium]|nr:circadian clock protein KaiB [Bacteroidota bacterium]
MESGSKNEIYRLKLFVSGMSENSITAIRNINDVCVKYLTNNYSLEVIDVYKQPWYVQKYDLIACPTLINESSSQSVKRFISNLADLDNILNKLGIRPGEVRSDK